MFAAAFRGPPVNFHVICLPVSQDHRTLFQLVEIHVRVHFFLSSFFMALRRKQTIFQSALSELEFE